MIFLIFILIMLPLSILDYGKKTVNVSLSKEYILLCCLIYFVIVAGGRYYPTNSDWILYRSAFEASGKIGDIRLQGYFEPGFELLLNIIKTFTNQYYVFFITYEIIACIFLYYNVKKYIGYPITTCCLYLPVMFLSLDLFFIRALLAVQIFIFSIQYIKERKAVSFYLCTFCAITVHISSIILLPLYFILHKRFTNRVILIIIIIGVMFYIIGIDFIIPMLKIISPISGNYIGGKINNYLFSIYNTNRPIGLIHLEFIFFFILLMKYRKRFERYSIYSNIFFNLFILYGIVIFYFWNFLIFTARFKFFFLPSMFFIIPRLIALNKKNFIVVHFCYTGYVLAMVFYLLYWAVTFKYEYYLVK